MEVRGLKGKNTTHYVNATLRLQIIMKMGDYNLPLWKRRRIALLGRTVPARRGDATANLIKNSISWKAQTS